MTGKVFPIVLVVLLGASALWGQLLIDDFEGYTDESPNLIFETWMDGYGYATGPRTWSEGNGTGSTVGNMTAPYAEQSIVNEGGLQSMPLSYDNTAAPYVSEVSRSFAAPAGATSLSLSIRGRQPVGTLILDEATGTYTMVTAGANYGWGDDRGHYAYKTLKGDGSMTCLMHSVEKGIHDWTKGGPRIAADLGKQAADAMMLMAAQDWPSCQWRSEAGGGTSETNDAVRTGALPIWLKISRVGNTITAEHMAADTNEWTVEKEVEIVMDEEVVIGLAACSHVGGAFAEFVFSDVSFTGDVSPAADVPLTAQHIDQNIASNTAEQVYVGIGGDTGDPVIITNTDPAVTQQTEWKDWIIVDLSGVDLSTATKFIIGVGDGEPGGSGKVYIDDIMLNFGL